MKRIIDGAGGPAAKRPVQRQVPLLHHCWVCCALLLCTPSHPRPGPRPMGYMGCCAPLLARTGPGGILPQIEAETSPGQPAAPNEPASAYWDPMARYTPRAPGLAARRPAPCCPLALRLTTPPSKTPQRHPPRAPQPPTPKRRLTQHPHNRAPAPRRAAPRRAQPRNPSCAARFLSRAQWGRAGGRGAADHQRRADLPAGRQEQVCGQEGGLRSVPRDHEGLQGAEVRAARRGAAARGHGRGPRPHWNGPGAALGARRLLLRGTAARWMASPDHGRGQTMRKGVLEALAAARRWRPAATDAAGSSGCDSGSSGVGAAGPPAAACAAAGSAERPWVLPAGPLAQP